MQPRLDGPLTVPSPRGYLLWCEVGDVAQNDCDTVVGVETGQRGMKHLSLLKRRKRIGRLSLGWLAERQRTDLPAPQTRSAFVDHDPAEPRIQAILISQVRPVQPGLDREAPNAVVMR